jgi:hypothetical protein
MPREAILKWERAALARHKEIIRPDDFLAIE